MAGMNQRNQKNFDSSDLFSRRDSVSIAGADFQQELCEKLVDLRAIWNEVGMTEDQRRERMDTALSHLKTLLSDMVEEETQMRDTLIESLSKSKKEVDTLLRQLRQRKPSFLEEPEIATFTLLQLEEKCRGLKEELIKERDIRIQERDTLLKEHAKYSSRLGVEEFDIDKTVVPERAALEILKRDIDRIKQDWEENMMHYIESRKNIMQLHEKVQLEETSLTKFQRQVFTMTDHVRNPKLVLSRDNMFELADLETKLNQKYNAYLEEIRQRISVVQVELTKWWDQCHVPQPERERFETVDPEVDPERAVEEYNKAIQHWRSFYESRKTILDKIGEWERLWQEHVEFEEREHDPNRYNNRGGALLQEEKRRKHVQFLLPRVYQQLSAMVSEYDDAHPEGAFFMDGMPVMEYIDSIQEEYQDKKKKEKEEKELLKKQQLMAERMYGAKAATPASKKKIVGTAGNITPSRTVSPHKKGLGVSKVYVHSSLSTLRSPGTKVLSQPGSGTPSTRKPPSGLPIRGQTQKRKALVEQQDGPGASIPIEAQPLIDTPAQAEGHSTASSTASYGEFAKVLRSRGLDVQSSFIGGKVQSPSKIARLE